MALSGSWHPPLILRATTTMPLSQTNSESFSVFSFKTEEEGVPVTTTCTSKNIKIVPCILGQDKSATKDNIWGCPRFFTTTSAGEKDVSNQNLMNHQHRSNHLVHHFRSKPLRVPYAHPRASSVVKLIRKVKKSSPHAMAMTRVLSTRFMDIMTHPTARDVILQCLLLFPAQPNEVLYEKALFAFSRFGHTQWWMQIIEQLHRPHRNYVVQNFLGLKDGDITNKIIDQLQNQFIRLAVTKEGSLVVEKCMEASNNGIIRVAAEIVNCPGAAFRLARNQFGNYVIQAALKKTKERGFSSFYDAIVRCLEPHRRALGQTAGGKNVLSILEADDE
ncbi:UNVERIFIED_CONTAM: putative pumilio19 [Sesamum radiatum]|uniref:Pumilio19 n=1 Tax=Sesamum radiatum TaxID=300843 RepID=A0AAW2K9W6_SESRA